MDSDTGRDPPTVGDTLCAVGARESGYVTLKVILQYHASSYAIRTCQSALLAGEAGGGVR